jgi:hypothetical protein
MVIHFFSSIETVNEWTKNEWAFILALCFEKWINVNENLGKSVIDTGQNCFFLTNQWLAFLIEVSISNFWWRILLP